MANVGFYDVVVSNFVGTATSTGATLTFQPTVDAFDLAVNGNVYALAPQPDGKVLLGGGFTVVNSQSRSNLARLNADGTLDTTFKPPVGGYYSVINSLVVQPDGRILVAGSFSSLCGQPRTNIARLNPDGTLDASFNPRAGGSCVYCMALQADGKILLGGLFTNLIGQPRTNLARLNPEGTLDTAFNPGASASVYSLAVQADGGILVGGGFTTLSGQARSHIGRLNASGILDTNFNPGCSGSVYSLLVQPDGRILLGGSYISLAGQTCSCFARLKADGSFDTGFGSGASTAVYSMALQADGKILASGGFGSLGGQGRSYIGRLAADGTVDPNFNPGANGMVYALAVHPDGRVLAGGAFTTFGGQTRTRIARIPNPDAASHALLCTDTNITWLRAGACPELCRAAFGVATNGADWLTLGPATYSAGGWQLNSISVPPGATLRARGYAAGGYQNGSCWFVEDGSGPPAISLQPFSQTNFSGSNIAFSVVAAGTAPFTYQWRKEGAELTDSTNVYGAHAPSLTLFGISGADRGGYSIVVSNSFGSVTSSIAALRVVDPWITLQPVSQLTNAGQTVTFKVSVVRTSPFTYQWRKNGTTLAGASLSSLTLTNVQWADAGNYDVFVSNLYGTSTSTPAALALPVALDTLNSAPNGAVYALALQTDGKILAGGAFTTMGSQTRNRMARLLADGTLDASFNPNAADSVYCLAVQTDGRILLGGIFTNLGNQARAYLARVNADGSLDAAFNPSPSTNVNAIALQPDGRIVVGGAFTNLCGQPCSFLGRLNLDGTFDTNFSAAAGGPVYSLALQPDGGLLVGGAFTNLCGQTCKYVGRLNTDSTLDTTFTPAADSNVYCLQLQPDGGVLVGGGFTVLCGTTQPYLGRLNADGTLDTSFNSVANGTVYSLAVQADGRILAGGNFTTLGGQTRRYLGRLNADGTLDSTLNPGAGSSVYALDLQADGKILAGGNFTTFAGQNRTRLARISNTYPANQDLAFDGLNVTWQRNGASPQVWRTSFEASTNGILWTALGDGVPVPGGWQMPANSLPVNSTVFARGSVAGGYANSSGWFVEASAGPPAIRSQPASRTNNAGTAATFAAVLAGTPTLGCRWFKDGVSLNDSGKTSGTRTSLLTVSNVVSADAGQYWLIVTNAFGSITSLVATLNVNDPSINSQPLSRTANADTTVNLSVQAGGTLPMSFQWYKDGTPLTNAGNVSGALTTSLTLSNVFGADAGAYWLTVSNALGAVNSQVATVNVMDPLITSQPTNQYTSLGQTALFTVSAKGTAPMGYQWRRNGAPIAAATAPSLTLSNAQRADIATYDVVVTNRFMAATSAVASLTVNLALPDSLNSGADGTVQCLAVQPDGKIIVGGTFYSLGGQPCTNLGRLNADGTLDTNFSPNIVGGVNALAVQTDRKILVGGSFWTVAGRPFTNLCRLNPDGGLEEAFNPAPAGWLSSIAIQADGKIVVAGGSSGVTGQPFAGTARFNPDGTLDTNFVGSVSPSAWCMALQPDGKILAGGLVESLGGTGCLYLGRLNTDGTRDTGFNPAPSYYVYCLTVQPDGKILVGGDFSTLAGQPCSYFGRLNPNGTLDTAFSPGANNLVRCFALQADGKILVGGSFTTLLGAPRVRIGRLNSDGTLDPTFNPGADSDVNILAVQPDGALLAGGYFYTLGGATRNHVGRLASTDAATDNLTLNGSTFTWSRSGSGPEFWRTTLEISTNGADWTGLGIGTPVPGGWRLSGISLPPNALVRARGFLTGGGYTSAWFVETVLAPERALVFANDSMLGCWSNQFEGTLTATIGRAVVIEASTDLTNWIPIQTNAVPPGGVIWFTDPACGSLPRSFYRARYY